VKVAVIQQASQDQQLWPFRQINIRHYKIANRPHVYTPQFWRVPPPSVLLLHALSEGDTLQQSANKLGPVQTAIKPRVSFIHYTAGGGDTNFVKFDLVLPPTTSGIVIKEMAKQLFG
jgi:hypothetical protein